MKRGNTKKTTAMAMVYLMLFYTTSLACAGGGGAGGGGGLMPPTNSYLTRLAVEQQLRQQVFRVSVNIWNNENSYRAESSVAPDGWAELKIDNPKPGAYSMYIGQEVLRDNGNTFTAFEDRSEIVIKNGGNIFSRENMLTLVREIPIKIELPEEYNRGDNPDELRPTATLQDGSVFGCGWGAGGENAKEATIWIPVDATKVSINFRGKQYTISAPFFLGAMGSGNILPLNAFPTVTLTSVTIRASIMENYLLVPTDGFKTIQSAIDYAQSGQTIVVKNGVYNEQLKLKDGVPIIGDPTCPQCVMVTSNESHTVKAEIGGEYSLSGLTIKNGYIGEKYYSTAAVVTDLGPSLKMNHCIVETTGTADPIATNYSKLELTNVTIKGSGSGVIGVNLYHNGPNDIFKNLLFYNLGSAMRQNNEAINGKIKVTNSLFWQTTTENIKSDSSNVSGDPQLYWDYPNLNAPAVQAIMALDGNYPGALRPIPPPAQ